MVVLRAGAILTVAVLRKVADVHGLSAWGSRNSELRRRRRTTRGDKTTTFTNSYNFVFKPLLSRLDAHLAVVAAVPVSAGRAAGKRAGGSVAAPVVAFLCGNGKKERGRNVRPSVLFISPRDLLLSGWASVAAPLAGRSRTARPRPASRCHIWPRQSNPTGTAGFSDTPLHRE